MAETYQHHHQLQNQQTTGPSRFRSKTSGAGGEIVEVQGGHIVRSTGRKDRHSKVCTSKGPRDRRVRLSAHTAIQFYDVQDRLGYDRPSKAVDWLIKKAKTAIDKLAELPAWKPTATVSRFTNPNETSIVDHFEQHPDDNIVDNQLGCSQNSSFLPPSLDSDSIADTIKSFFPVGGSSNPANNNSSSGMQYHQDLRLSLQSFKDPILHNQQQQQQQTHQVDSNSNTNNNIYFDGSGWPENQSGGFVFSSPAPLLQPLFGQTITNELFNNNSRREPLQSSSTTTPSFRAWIDQMPPFGIDQHPTLAFHHPDSGLGGFSGFRVPARIQGAEERNGVSDRPSSASSDSRH